MAERKVLLEVQHLRKYFPIKNGMFRTEYVQAVEDVTFSLYAGETLGIVGESGCGKSTLGRSILRLHEPTSGKVTYDGTVIYDGEKKTQIPMLPYRKKMQIIFQDPSASLDPRMTVGEIVGEALSVHRPDLKGKAAYRARINELLETVGLNSEHSNRFPLKMVVTTVRRVMIRFCFASSWVWYRSRSCMVWSRRELDRSRSRSRRFILRRKYRSFFSRKKPFSFSSSSCTRSMSCS